MVLYCDNKDGLAEATCSYEKTIGTSYSSSISENMSIDRTIQSELTAQFFGLFSSSIGRIIYSYRAITMLSQEPVWALDTTGPRPPPRPDTSRWRWQSPPRRPPAWSSSSSRRWGTVTRARPGQRCTASLTTTRWGMFSGRQLATFLATHLSSSRYNKQIQ